MDTTYDTIIIGGGLAGLVAALRLARAGCRVTVLEASETLGGRARTLREEGLDFNLGPHALYVAGAARRILGALEVPVEGARAPLDGALAFHAGRAHGLPVGFVSLLSTGLLPLGAKLEVARFLGRLERIDAAGLAGRSVDAWLGSLGLGPAARGLVEALVRLSTYANAPAELDAGATVRQLQMSFEGVLYLHGGWGALINALASAARAAGVQVRTGVRAEAVLDAGDARTVRLAGGEVLSAADVVVAAAPKVVSKLLAGRPEHPAHAWPETLLPARAACLNVGLSDLPRPRRFFGLGIDRADYASVHTSVARLGAGHVAHVARYLAPGETPPSREALTEVFEQLQPGFRSRTLYMAYYPQMTVSHGVPRASAGGRRPEVALSSMSGVYVAGDWVGDEGLLADAACASADRAAQLILQKGRAQRAA